MCITATPYPPHPRTKHTLTTVTQHLVALHQCLISHLPTDSLFTKASQVQPPPSIHPSVQAQPQLRSPPPQSYKRSQLIKSRIDTRDTMPRRRRPNSRARAGPASTAPNSGSNSTASSPPSATSSTFPQNAAGSSSRVHDTRLPRVSAGPARPIPRNIALATGGAPVRPPPGLEDRPVRRSQTLTVPLSTHHSNSSSARGEQDGLEWSHLLPSVQRLDPTLDDAVPSTSTAPSIGVIGDRRGSAPEFGQRRGRKCPFLHQLDRDRELTHSPECNDDTCATGCHGPETCLCAYLVGRRSAHPHPARPSAARCADSSSGPPMRGLQIS